MENISQEQAYHQMHRMLNEKQWRQYLAVEAKQRGSVSQVAREAGVSLNTVKRGLKELEAGEGYQPGERIRKVGGGKKKLVETDAIFAQIKHTNEEADATEEILRISMDAKATVKVGPFARGGKSRVLTKACDHDFHAQAKVTKVGDFPARL